ncbi:MAG: hypothetical protein R3212_06645, partial [Xanthomonadales bacterium]|nr:hypothetical protein [Xanthomonadales bacterium]
RCKEHMVQDQGYQLQVCRLHATSSELPTSRCLYQHRAMGLSDDQRGLLLQTQRCRLRLRLFLQTC